MWVRYRGSVSEGLRIELVDDHEVVRQGVKAMLDAEQDMTVVGEAGSVEEAIRRVGFDNPDIVVMDVRLPDGSTLTPIAIGDERTANVTPSPEPSASF